MSAQFKDKVALVTGASQGIGRAIALELGRRGASVAVNYPWATQAGNAASVVAEIEAAGGRALAIEADLSEIAGIPALFDKAEAAFGQIDFVLSNVGGIVRNCRIEDFDEELFDKVMLLNAKSSFFVMKSAAARVRDGGRIIALSSSTTNQPYPGTAVYGGAKAAIELFCQVLSREVGHRGITVNALAPALTTSEGMLAAPPPAERIAEVEKATPLRRLGTPADIAKAAMMLLGDDAGWITSQVVRASGGFTW